MSPLRKYTLTIILAIFMVATGGCATQSRYYSSSVDYLYPGKTEPVESPTIPVMKIPMKVGIAFVPDAGWQSRGTSFWHGAAGNSGSERGLGLTENQKTELMQKVGGYFRKYPYIGSIEVIPSAYLIAKGSFTNLDQIRTMYGIDGIVLLSYDQVQFTDEGASSFLYWTIIGAYLVPGEKNTTQTMMDAVVYDIKSHKMLFRAPGLSQVKGSATPVNLSEELRKNGETGFDLASQDMITNLDTQLSLFKEKIKQAPQEYKIINRPGYTGGGNIGWWFGFILILAGTATIWRYHYNT